MSESTGRTLREARESIRMSQASLAEAAGLSEKTVRRAEGGHQVSHETLRCICSVLGMDSGDLDRQPPPPVHVPGPPADMPYTASDRDAERPYAGGFHDGTSVTGLSRAGDVLTHRRGWFDAGRVRTFVRKAMGRVTCGLYASYQGIVATGYVVLMPWAASGETGTLAALALANVPGTAMLTWYALRDDAEMRPATVAARCSGAVVTGAATLSVSLTLGLEVPHGYMAGFMTASSAYLSLRGVYGLVRLGGIRGTGYRPGMA